MTNFLHGNLTLPRYWELNRTKIANVRNWGRSTRTSSSAKNTNSVEERRARSIRQCNHTIEILSHFLPDKAMADLSAFELLGAVQASKCANGRVYAESTLKGRLSLLRDIYGFAEMRGDACNDIAYISNLQVTHYLKGIELPLEERQKHFRQLAAENRTKARSLSAAQQAKLVRIILEHIEDDGRYLALAILLYTGMRPSECRGLCWHDFVPFLSHPERHMLPLDRQRDDQNHLVDRLKRPSSYRKVGVHFELEQIIQKRLSFILANASSFEKIADFPMCCYQNAFSRGCTHSQLSSFATKVLKNSLRGTEDVMMSCIIDLFAYDSESLTSGIDNSEDLRISTYLLRHDFWTWMQASTELSGEEKRYLFGHAIYDGSVDRRPLYNNEDTLWEMLVKLDHVIKFYPLHEARLHGCLGPDSTLSAPNKGHYTLELSPDLLLTGGRVIIELQANEYNAPITLKALSPTKTAFRENPLELRAVLLPHIREETYRRKANTDYDNRMIRHFTKPLTEDTDEEAKSKTEINLRIRAV